MEAYIKKLKKFILNEVEKNFSDPYYSDLRILCIDSVACFSIFKSATLGSPIRTSLIEEYYKLSTLFNLMFKIEFEAKINDINFLIIDLLTSLFHMPQSFVSNIIESIRNANIKLTSDVISFVLGSSFTALIGDLIDFETIWSLFLQPFFTNIGVVHTENRFSKDFLRILLCEDSQKLVLKQKIYPMCQVLFGKIRNFKFFRKACKIFYIFQGPLNHLELQAYPFNLSITCTSVPQEFQNNQTILNESKTFLLKPPGLESSKRCDGLTLIGKHEFCDLRLPDDHNVDDISFAVFYRDSRYLVVDCSKKGYLKSKLHGLSLFQITKDLLIDLVGASVIRVSDLRFGENQDDGKVIGEIFFEFLKGELAGAAGNRMKCFKTIRRNRIERNMFVFGRGQAFEELDIVLSEGRRISKKHLMFKFQDQGWYVEDIDSHNGSFVLFKDFEQYTNALYSKPKPLFLVYSKNGEKIFDNLGALLTISGYSFYFCCENS